MPASPAKVVAHYLAAEGIGTLPGGAGPWYVYYGKEPNQPDIDPELAVTVYDDTHINDNSPMRAVPTCSHPGIDVRIRAVDQVNPGDGYDFGYDKGQDIVAALSRIDGDVLVTIPGDPTAYKIQSYVLGQNLAWLKEEDPEKKRQIFTINGGHITLWVGGV